MLIRMCHRPATAPRAVPVGLLFIPVVRSCSQARLAKFGAAVVAVVAMAERQPPAFWRKREMAAVAVRAQMPGLVVQVALPVEPSALRRCFKAQLVPVVPLLTEDIVLAGLAEIPELTAAQDQQVVRAAMCLVLAVPVARLATRSTASVL